MDNLRMLLELRKTPGWAVFEKIMVENIEKLRDANDECVDIMQFQRNQGQINAFKYLVKYMGALEAMIEANSDPQQR